MFALKLLKKGADPTVMYDHGFQPLPRAICDGHVETADAVYGFMNSEQRERVFGESTQTGFTLTGRIVSQWLNDRNPQLIDSLQWLHSEGGAQWLGDARNGMSALGTILRRL